MEESKKRKLANFDENGVLSSEENLFGLPFDENESELIIIPAVWDATVSFRPGTSQAPKAVLKASYQIDFYDADYPDYWQMGIFMKPIDKKWEKTNASTRKKSEKLISYLEKGRSLPQDSRGIRPWKEIDEMNMAFKNWVKNEAKEMLQKNKLVGVLGGEHTVCLGLIEALSKKHSSFGILQLDAHLDLRDSYEGFRYSHASAMRRALEEKSVSKLINVGARDYSQEEVNFLKSSPKKIIAFPDRQLEEKKFQGKTWHDIAQEIIKNLPEKVYVSFDIDALNPSLCPGTGTPMPGGLEYESALYLIKQIVDSGREIIGFDLSEIAPASSRSKDWPSDWNAIVGSHLLYRLAILALKK